MTCIDFVTIEAADPAAADFYATPSASARIRLRASEAATSGFRGFTLSLTVSQPADVSALSTPPSPPAPRR